MDLFSYELLPLFDRLIVEPDPTEETTAGGIILVQEARPKPDTGTVVATGPGKSSNLTGFIEEMPVKVGDRILFHQHAGVEITVDDGKYLILNSGDVMARVKRLDEPEQNAAQDAAPAAE